MPKVRRPGRKEKVKLKNGAVVEVDVGQMDKVVERRRFLLKLIARGITSEDDVREMYRQKGFDVADRTIRDDRAAVRETLHAAYSGDLAANKDEITAQFDDIAIQLQQIAKDAQDKENNGGKRSFYAAVQALGKKADVMMNKAKLMGVVVDRQEVNGSVTNLNVNTDVPATKEDVEGVLTALNKLPRRRKE